MSILSNFEFYEPKPSLDNNYIHNKLLNCNEIYFQYWTKGNQYNFIIDNEIFEINDVFNGYLDFKYFIKTLYYYLENNNNNNIFLNNIYFLL